VTTFRAIAFSLTGLIAIVVGVMASRWSRERRIRRGDAGRPGVPTLLCASLPVILLGLVLLAPDDSNAAGSVVLIYMFYGAVAGFFAVPALILAGVVIALTGERRQTSARARERLEAATIAIADALIVLGLPLAVTLAYLQGTGGLCLS
jgi:hypothetical protein